MISRIRVIGIGMGDPGHATGEAARALATVDVFLIADKDAASADLVAARQCLPPHLDLRPVGFEEVWHRR